MKEPVKEPEWKPVQCVSPLYVSEKLAQFDKHTRTIAENRFSNILFDSDMNSILPVPINPPPPINHPLPINPPLPINVPRPSNPDNAGNVQNDYLRVGTAVICSTQSAVFLKSSPMARPFEFSMLNTFARILQSLNMYTAVGLYSCMVSCFTYQFLVN